MRLALIFAIQLAVFGNVCSIHFSELKKVIVPSVYNEWDHGIPDWATLDMQRKFNYSVFLYQKTNASAPNYISTNRGTEGGVYLRYIVDHYESFPDVAVFVHAAPEKHAKKWWMKVQCISPSATYFNINDERIQRHSYSWGRVSVWMEQCWKDVLRVVWSHDQRALARIFSHKFPIKVDTTCCQQFIMSRQMVHARPLEVWKQLHQMIAVEDVCHSGPLNHDRLNSVRLFRAWKAAAEDALNSTENDHGQLIQGGTMEHLAHVVFGQQPLITTPPRMNEFCHHFEEAKVCPGSPCVAKPTAMPTAIPAVMPTAKPSVEEVKKVLSESDRYFLKKRESMFKTELRMRRFPGT